MILNDKIAFSDTPIVQFVKFIIHDGNAAHEVRFVIRTEEFYVSPVSSQLS